MNLDRHLKLLYANGTEHRVDLVQENPSMAFFEFLHRELR